jgi:hypothetical protein
MTEPGLILTEASRKRAEVAGNLISDLKRVINYGVYAKGIDNVAQSFLYHARAALANSIFQYKSIDYSKRYLCLFGWNNSTA